MVPTALTMSYTSSRTARPQGSASSGSFPTTGQSARADKDAVRFSTMREQRDAIKGVQRPEKAFPLSHRSTICGGRRAPAGPTQEPSLAARDKTIVSRSGGGVRDRTSDGSEATVTSPTLGEAPLRNYTGPTPKSLDGVRAAFFETKGMSLESIKEWEWHCLQADMEVLGTAVQNKRVAGTITGYDDGDGFTGSATTRGTLKLWLLSQARFNSMKVVSLWARLGRSHPLSCMVPWGSLE
jgi:hypothetical protein